MTEKNYWYRHNIDPWQGSANIAALSDTAYRAYHNLIMYQIQQPNGMIPADERTLRIQSRVPTRWDKVREEVLAMLEYTPDRQYVYDYVQLVEWQRAVVFAEKREAKAKAAAEARWRREQEQLAKNAPSMPDACSEHPQAMLGNATVRNVTKRNEEPKNNNSEPEVDLSDVTLRIVCAHPKSRIKFLSPVDVTPLESQAAMRAIVAEASQANCTMHEAAEVILALTEEITRQTPRDQVRFVPGIENYFNRREYRLDADTWSGNGKSNSSGSSQGKGAGNLRALAEVLGVNRPTEVDQRTARVSGDSAPGDDRPSGIPPVLEGTLGLPPRRHSSGGESVGHNASP